MNTDIDAPYFAAKCSLQADAFEFRRASVWLADNCQQLAVPESHINRLDLALNEVLANILAHGGDSAKSAAIELTFDYFHLQAFNKINIRIIDGGIAFNPLLVNNKPLASSLMDAEPGGLGLLMLQKLTDDMHYSYEQNRNQLVLTVYWLEAE